MPSSAFTTTLFQSTILNALSNILAQIIAQYGNDNPFHLNLLPLIQYLAYNIIITPINFSWQRYLEVRYPGFPRRLFGKTADSGSGDLLPVKEKEDDAPAPVPVPGSGPGSGMKSFIAKFLLDQTVGSVMNIVLFLVLINVLQGAGVERVWEAILVDFKPIMIARLKYRPVVSTLMYTVVPVDRRVVFGSACGVIWGVYLSLYAAV